MLGLFRQALWLVAAGAGERETIERERERRERERDERERERDEGRWMGER